MARVFAYIGASTVGLSVYAPGSWASAIEKCAIRACWPSSGALGQFFQNFGFDLAGSLRLPDRPRRHVTFGQRSSRSPTVREAREHQDPAASSTRSAATVSLSALPPPRKQRLRAFGGVQQRGNWSLIICPRSRNKSDWDVRLLRPLWIRMDLDEWLRQLSPAKDVDPEQDLAAGRTSNCRTMPCGPRGGWPSLLPGPSTGAVDLVSACA